MKYYGGAELLSFHSFTCAQRAGGLWPTSPKIMPDSAEVSSPRQGSTLRGYRQSCSREKCTETIISRRSSHVRAPLAVGHRAGDSSRFHRHHRERSSISAFYGHLMTTFSPRWPPPRRRYPTHEASEFSASAAPAMPLSTLTRPQVIPMPETRPCLFEARMRYRRRARRLARGARRRADARRENGRRDDTQAAPRIVSLISTAGCRVSDDIYARCSSPPPAAATTADAPAALLALSLVLGSFVNISYSLFSTSKMPI